MQPSPAPQVWSQEPQFAVSVFTLAQLSPQSMPPFGHAHCPAWHSVPAGHALPHAPQFKTLVCVSTQLVPHCVRAPQPEAQRPDRHTCLAEHATSHAPQ